MKNIVFFLHPSLPGILLLLAAAVVFVLLYKRIRPRIGDVVFLVLGSLMLLNPGIEYRKFTEYPPLALFLDDISLSSLSNELLSNLHDGFLERQEQAAALGFSVGTYSFGNGYTAGGDYAPVLEAESRLGEVLEYLGSVYAGRNALIFLHGDGNYDERTGQSPFPLYAAVYDREESLSNSTILGLHAEELWFTGETEDVYVDIFAAEPLRVQLAIEGMVLAAQEAAPGRQRLHFRVRPPDAGFIVLSVSLRSHSDYFPLDDRAHALLRVEQKRKRVTVLYDFPDPEISFLKSYLESHFTVDIQRVHGYTGGSADVHVLIAFGPSFRDYPSLMQTMGRESSIFLFMSENNNPDNAYYGTFGLKGPARSIGSYMPLTPLDAQDALFGLPENVSYTHQWNFTSYPPGMKTLQRADSGRPLLAEWTHEQNYILALFGGPLWKADFQNRGYGIQTGIANALYASVFRRLLERGSAVTRLHVDRKSFYPGETIVIRHSALDSGSRIELTQLAVYGDEPAASPAGPFAEQQNGALIESLFKTDVYGVYAINLVRKDGTVAREALIQIEANKSEYRFDHEYGMRMLQNLSSGSGGAILQADEHLKRDGYAPTSHYESTSMELQESLFYALLLLCVYSAQIIIYWKKNHA